MGKRVKALPESALKKSLNVVPGQKGMDSSKTLSAAPDRILFLQRNLGNRAVQSLFESGALQAKLKVGSPGDIYEQEADRIADEVMRMPEVGVRTFDGGGGTVQTKKETGQGRGNVSDYAPRNIISGGSGQALSESVRRFFEPRLGGRDLSGVRVHADTGAGESASALNASAFTSGRDIYFGEGRYRPDTTVGKRLLAHELTHVVQQDGGSNAVQRQMNGDESSDVLRPPGLPVEQGFILQPVSGLSDSFASNIQEGQIVTISETDLLSAIPPASPGAGTFLIEHPTAVTTPIASGSIAALSSVDSMLRATGFAAAGENAIGVVAIPRWFTPGAMLPESVSVWGHTAVYARTGGSIQVVRGFMPASIVRTLLNASAIEGGLAGTPGAIASDVSLFTRTGAWSIEYPLAREAVEAFARGLPETGPTGTLYTARPAVSNLCVGTNCVQWAVGEAEGALAGRIGPRVPGVSVTALAESGEVISHTASQGRLVAFIQRAAEVQGEVAAVEQATGEAVASGMPRSLQVLKWGGRIFLVIGAATIPLEVAMAPEGERVRTAVGATSGFVSGLAAGAAAGLLCGPGAPVCSVVLGIGFGIGGYFAGRIVAEGAYDVATGRTSIPLRVDLLEHSLYVCFTGDTRILLPDSSWRPISEIEAGEKILAFDENENSLSVCKVMRVFKNPPQDYLKIVLDNDVLIKVTSHHHLFADRGWTKAGDIRVDDLLLYCDDTSKHLTRQRVSQISKESAAEDVYDLSVEDHHNYFAEGVLAHNKL